MKISCSFRNRNGPARSSKSAAGRTRPRGPGNSREACTGGCAPRRGDMTDVDESAVDKNALFRRIRQSTRCQQKEAVEAQAGLRLRRLLSAVSRNQARAALASDQNERQRFLLSGESDNNRSREAGVSAGAQKACRTPGWPCSLADEGTPPRGPGGRRGTKACAGRMESGAQRRSAA
jgi:hypothetical protein